MSFGWQASLRLIAESLRLIDRFGADPIVVRDVRMDERVLVVELTAVSTDPVRIKAEIAGVMGALSGLEVPTTFPSLEVQQFGVRAFDSGGHEIMWIVSSVEAAGFAARGQPIEWLSSSLVQENTSEYRRAQADRKIGRLEITLRDLTHMHAEQRAGPDYLNQLWNDTSKMRVAAQREGLDAEDARSVLDYAYLHSLGTAIREHIDWFGDGCVPDGERFDDAITQLNKVRRKVAHYRAISDGDLRVAREATECVMAPIGHTHPELADDFLVDRWEERVNDIMEDMQREFRGPQVSERGDVPEFIRRSAAVEALQTQLTAVELATADLDRLIVPDARRELHETATACLRRWWEALSDMVTVARSPVLDVATAEAAAGAYAAALEEVGQLRTRIQALRLGIEAA